jgi:hypothetical protein
METEPGVFQRVAGAKYRWPPPSLAAVLSSSGAQSFAGDVERHQGVQFKTTPCLVIKQYLTA